MDVSRVCSGSSFTGCPRVDFYHVIPNGPANSNPTHREKDYVAARFSCSLLQQWEQRIGGPLQVNSAKYSANPELIAILLVAGHALLLQQREKPFLCVAVVIYKWDISEER
jgi:hypothetical protein